MVRIYLPVLFCVLFACSAGAELKENKPVTTEKITIGSGAISGISGKDPMVKIFRGIPYATPPLGSLRWKAPQPVQPWTGIRKCDVFPPSAMQAKPVPFAMWSKEFMAPVEPLSEDCLYMNVWTTAKTQQDKLPVIVWIHGGAFTGGSGSVPLYDGEEMAKKGVVFITINYRLGIFGFLAHPDLSKESPNHVSGNYGILDQIAALQWVKKNVAAFGGDPDRVAIAGQSAGSISVNALLVSPLAKGLFQRAIAESGAMFYPADQPSGDLAAAEKAGADFFRDNHIASLEQLRSASADELLKKGGRMGIVIDGYVIPPSYPTFKAGRQNDVPLLTGWNANDNVGFGNQPTAEKFRAFAANRFGEQAPQFLKLFPAGNDKQAQESQTLLSVLSFGGQNYRMAMMQDATGKSDVYLYYFSRVPPGEPNYGAFHSAEFGYALKTLKLWDRPFTAYDHQLADMMSSYWVNFAASGNPNGKGLPVWPAFKADSKKVVLLGDEVTSAEVPFREQLEFLEKFDFGPRGLGK
jgi:para-nitrobenzyl esterase